MNPNHNCNRCNFLNRICINCELKALKAALRESSRLIESGKPDKAQESIKAALR